MSNERRQRGFPFVDQNTTYGQSGPVRSALKRPEVREAICASERASDDNGPDRRFVCYIVRHLHTQREKERKRERLPPGTIVESWESSDYIRPINFFAGTDPTVSHGVLEPGGRREEEKEEAAPVLFFMRARLTRLYRGMRLATRPGRDPQLHPDRACYVLRRSRND